MAGPRFRPYRGLEADIKKLPNQEGYVYFTTDTGKIYLDYKGERIAMGGSGASLMYAAENDVAKDTLGRAQINFSSIENQSEQAVKIGDLIINTDGVFYKVVEINTNTNVAFCKQIAVSGTGGGGGGTGGGGSSSSTNIDVVAINGGVPFTFIYGQSQEVSFKATATADTMVNVSLEVYGADNQKTTKTIGLKRSDTEFTIDIGKELFKGSNRIVVHVYGDNSGFASREFSARNSVELALHKNSSFNPYTVYDGTIPFSFIPIGTIDKTIEIKLNSETIKRETIPASITNRSYTINIEKPENAHGIYTLEAQLRAEINGTEIITDAINYQIAWKTDGINTPLIWFPNGYSEDIIQYEDMVIEYLVWDPTNVNNKEIETHFYKDGKELASSPRSLSYTNTGTLKWNITDYEVGRNNYTISVGSANKSINFVVEKDTQRDLDIVSGGLVVNLDAAGRSNEENATSRATWTSKGTDAKIPVSFRNFNWYNNGWIIDDDGKSCLRVSNGASISIPLNEISGGILRTDTMSSPLAFEFRFKIRNVQEYANLVSTSAVEENGKVKVVKTVETSKGVFGSLYNNNVGLCLGTQEIFFKSNNEVVNANYREDEIVSAAIVIDEVRNNNRLMTVYLNGIMSSISSYSSSSLFNSGINELTFNSDYCDVDIYNIRIYKGVKLDSVDIVHNYVADKKDANEYDINQIAVSTTSGIPTIDYSKLIEYNNNHPDETTLPYMVIESLDGVLPFVKGGKKAVNIEFHNPAADYAWKQGLISDDEYLHSSPSFTYSSKKGSLNVQGTSSQGYPRRNYKWKAKQSDATWRYLTGPLEGQPIYELDPEQTATKGKDVYVGSKLNDTTYKKFYLDNDIGETTFCLKADYMESSGTHNTGFTSYVKEMYSKHPLQDQFQGQTIDEGLRTTIYGFPILVFQKTGNSYDFVGRYNMNLDKGATDTDGFTYEGIRNGEKIDFSDIAECWEFCNNQGNRCSFTQVEFDKTHTTYTSVGQLGTDNWKEDTYYIITAVDTSGNETYELSTQYNANDIYYTKSEGVLEILDDFEYRYSAYEDDIEDAIDGVGKFTTSTQAERNSFILEKMDNLRKVCEWLKSTENDLEKFRTEFTQHFDLEYCSIYFIMTELLHLYDSRGKNMMLATWGPRPADRNGAWPDSGENYVWYPIFYDADTQLGINNSGVPTWDYSVEPTDSNLFSTSNSILWNNLWTVFKNDILNRYVNLRMNNLNIDKLNGYYNAYPIPGREDINSIKQMLSDDVETFDSLHNKLTAFSKIGKRPVMIYNVDQYYKYIAPTTIGFINTSGETVRDSGTFYYCLQGSRELMRYLYLRNRLNYLDSKWHGGSYSVKQTLGEFWARYNANVPGTTSDNFLATTDPNKIGTKATLTYEIGDQKFNGEFNYYDANNYPQPLDAVGDFNGVKSYLRQYMSLQLDQNQLDPVYCNGETAIDLKVPSKIANSVRNVEGFSQQLVYIGGGEYISDLGDLGLKYIDELKIPTLKRLKALRLGSDVKGYYNSQLNENNFSIAASATITNEQTKITSSNKNAKTLLETVILTGLSSLGGTIDLTGSEKLKEFRALNTNISAVSLADGVQIETLHLPTSITTLSLIEPTSLSGIITEDPVEYDDDDNFVRAKKGLYIEGLTDAADSDNIKLTTYEVIGGNMRYDTYTLLDKIVKMKNHMIADNNLDKSYSKTLQINLKDVNWSPYTLVDNGEEYDENKQYFYDNGRFQLKPYVHANDTWTDYTLNGKIYMLDNTINTYSIANASVLKTFIDDYESAMTYYSERQDNAENHYRSIADTTIPTMPEITGIMYIDNDSNYGEQEIEAVYVKHFPNLKIFFKNVATDYAIDYVSSIDGKETLMYKQRIPKASGENHPTYPDDVIPARLNYDFIGWALSVDGTAMSKEEVEALTFDNSTDYIKLYAIFDTHKFNINFYNYVNGIEEKITTLEIEAGSAIVAPAGIPSRNEDGLAINKRYKFIGYVSNKEDVDNEKRSLFNFSAGVVAENQDRDFYACYELEDVHDSITDTSLFNFTSRDYIDVLDGSYSLSGWVITPKTYLSGKITIPKEYNNKPIIALAGFNGYYGAAVSHIFFETGGAENIRYIAENAFYGQNGVECSIKWIENMPNLRRIEAAAFEACANLMPEFYDFSNTQLYFIGRSAFQASTNKFAKTLRLPGSLTTLEEQAFAYMLSYGYAAFEEICIGSASDRSNLDLYYVYAVQDGIVQSPFASPSSATGIKGIVRFIIYPKNNIGMNTADIENYIYDSLAGSNTQISDISIL